MLDRQSVEELRRTGPVPRVLGQAGRDQGAQLPGNVREIRLFVDDPVGPRRRHPVSERRPPGRLPEHHTQGEHVHGGSERAPGELLRREEAEGADLEPGLGEGRTVEGPGDAEVDDPGAVLRDDDVGRFQVTVDDPGLVDGRQCLGEAAWPAR